MDKRQQAMTELRNAVKRSSWRYADIAAGAGVSSSWIGDVLRGNYPHYGANWLPRNIARELVRLGFIVPDSLVS